MKTIVEGIEMFCNQRLLGTAVCDTCGKEVHWDKYSGLGQEFESKTEGWLFPEGLKSGGAALCPDCI